MGREPARRGDRPRLYSASPRADGGIGRRARLRAWSGITGWRFESSSAHRESPANAGLSSLWASWRAIPWQQLWQHRPTVGPQFVESPGTGATRCRAEGMRLDGLGAKPDQVDGLGRDPT